MNMNKEIKFSNDAMLAIKKGIDVAGDAVRITIGPRGRNVMIDSPHSVMPEITNDGVTILENIFLKNKFENMGVKLQKEAARKTDLKAKDGTTTTAVLLQAIVDEGIKVMRDTTSPIIMGDGIMHAAKLIDGELVKMAVPVSSDIMRKEVAYISSENPEMAEVVAEVIKKVGDTGIVSFEEREVPGFSYEMVDGMQIDKGYISPFMVNRNDKMIAEYSDVPVLVTDKRILASAGFLTQQGDGLIQRLSVAGHKSLVIFCEELDGEGLATLLLNHSRRVFSVLAIKIPGYGPDSKREALEDIAAKVGAMILTDHSGVTFDKVELSTLGHARKITSTEHDTVIAGGNETTTLARLGLLRNKNAEEKSVVLENRIAKLEGKVAIISYGAETQTRAKYLKRKLEDTVGTVQSACAEGIVPGGGSALLQAVERVRGEAHKNLEPEFRLGMEVMFKACRAPITNIIKNAGREENLSEIINHAKQERHGYDAKKNEFVKEMVIHGITDAVRVTRNALTNASTQAAAFLTTGAGMVEEVEEKKD